MAHIGTSNADWEIVAKPEGLRLNARFEAKPEGVRLSVRYPDYVMIYEFRPQDWVNLVQYVLGILCEEQEQALPIIKVKWEVDCESGDEREALRGGDPVASSPGRDGRQPQGSG